MKGRPAEYPSFQNNHVSDSRVAAADRPVDGPFNGSDLPRDDGEFPPFGACFPARVIALGICRQVS
jgi:hypothetical protein